MSTIRVDNFGPSAGGTTYSARGIAKAWVNYNQQTPVVSDSENVSSVTDNATGDHTVNFSTSFSAATYSISGAGKYNNDNVNAGAPDVGPYRATGSISTTLCRIATPASGGGSGFDCIAACTTYHGDLA